MPIGAAQHSLTTWRAVSRRTLQLRITEPFTRAVTFPECSVMNSGPDGTAAGLMTAPIRQGHITGVRRLTGRPRTDGGTCGRVTSQGSGDSPGDPGLMAAPAAGPHHRDQAAHRERDEPGSVAHDAVSQEVDPYQQAKRKIMSHQCRNKVQFSFS